MDWRPWGAEALEAAKRQEKPIFLSIGYSACHWCHVMAHECFENAHIGRLLNENFISVKVDREERPDLDQIYMEAVQLMTGRGGWPMSVFLTPDAVPFFGGSSGRRGGVRGCRASTKCWPPQPTPGGIAARTSSVKESRSSRPSARDLWQEADGELTDQPLAAAETALGEASIRFAADSVRRRNSPNRSR